MDAPEANVVQAAPALAACASPDAYYQLGIDMLITGVVGVHNTSLAAVQSRHAIGWPAPHAPL